DPVAEDARRVGRSGVLEVALDQVAHERDVLRLIETLEIDHAEVTPALEVTVQIENVRDAPRHAGREVPAGASQDDDPTAGHVLAGMIADALHDRVDSAVTHAEALAGNAAHVGLAARRAVERDVADDDVLLGHEYARAGRIDRELAAREPLAPVVVGVTLEGERDTSRHERTEALARGSGEVDADRV